MKVNGSVVTVLGTQVDPGQDRVLLDDREVRQEPGLVYVLLNKPKGYLVSASDARGRKTVFDLLGGVPHRVFSVGRLDLDTEGVLLLTNDGQLAYRLMHPRYEIRKVYSAWVEGVPDAEDLAGLRAGVALEDGVSSPAEAALKEVKGGNALVELVIHEGRKRQVKRMLEVVGHPVVRLSRESFAGIGVGRLGRGKWRHLGAEEVEGLRREAGLA